MPFASGNRLTAARLGRMQPVTYQVVASGTLALGTALADVPGTVLNLTTTAAGAIYVAEGVFDVSVATAAAGQLAEGHLDVDGVDQAARALKSMAAVDRATSPQRWRGVLATAGSHSFTLRGLKSGASGVASIITTHTVLHVAIYEVV